jgi:hypothetical protein
MSRPGSAYGLLLALLLTLLTSSLAPAFEVCKTSGNADIKWNGTGATYKVNESGGPAGNLSSIQAGLQTWTDVQTASFTFTYAGATTKTSADHGDNDGENIVVFGPMGATGTLALNKFWYNASSGYIYDSDIQFNTSYAWSSSGSPGAYDVQSVSTHELGHSLCLSDLYGSSDTEKTMYGYSSAGDTKKRTLDPDDISGIAYLYPASQTFYSLSVSKSGSGTVTSSPPGISCGSDCSESYAEGTSVTLIASPASGWSFGGWGGACSGTGTCSLSMTAARSATATFVPNTVYYALDVSATGSGTVTSSPSGISCGSDCSESYAEGTSVTLTASPASGWSFGGWGGACSGTGTCSLSMTAARSVTAAFTQNTYSLNVAVSGSGTVTSSPGGIDCGSDCSEPYLSGTTVTLTAAPATYVNWTGCDYVAPAYPYDCDVLMASSRSVTIEFLQGTGNLSVTTTPVSGPIYVDGSNVGSGSWSGPEPVGQHTVSFGGVSGYNTPAPQTTTVSEGQTTNVTGTYTQAVPDITVSPATVHFDNVCVNLSAERTVTVRNDGDADLLIGSITPPSLPFGKVSDSCSGRSLPQSGSCAITVRFSPEAQGPFNGSLRIQSNDPDEDTVTVALTGTGTYSGECPDIALLPDGDLSFPNIYKGVTAEQALTVKNEGNVSLTIYGITQPALPFSISGDDCSDRTLQPAGTCELTVRFSPGEAGSYSSDFDIASNDPDENPVTINLNGSANENEPPSSPALLSPPNGSVDLPTTITMKWRKSIDPDGDPVAYSLYYCENSNFAGCSPVETASIESDGRYHAGLGGYMAGLLLIGMAFVKGRKKAVLMIAATVITAGLLLASCGGSSGDPPAGPADGEEVSSTVSGLQPGTTYYWKVIAEDGKGGTAESEVWTFRTE